MLHMLAHSDPSSRVTHLDPYKKYGPSIPPKNVFFFSTPEARESFFHTTAERGRTAARQKLPTMNRLMASTPLPPPPKPKGRSAKGLAAQLPPGVKLHKHFPGGTLNPLPALESNHLNSTI